MRNADDWVIKDAQACFKNINLFGVQHHELH